MSESLPLEPAPAGYGTPWEARLPRAGLTFASFVVGAANRAARDATYGLAEAERPRAVALAGPSGVGKTHLLSAMHHVCAAAGAPVLCLPAAELAHAFTRAVASGAVGAFWARLGSVATILLDDLHSVVTQRETQEQLAHGLADWLDGGRRLGVTSDRPPEEVQAVAAVWRERFSEVQLVAMHPPDAELRAAIVVQKARVLGLELDAATVSALATRLGGTVRRIEGALRRLLAHARLTGAAPDITLLGKAEPSLVAPPSPPTLDRIVRVVAECFAVSARALTGPSRAEVLVLPRRIAMFLARRLVPVPVGTIAETFGRDRTTVLHAVRLVEHRLTTDPELAGVVRRLEERLTLAP